MSGYSTTNRIRRATDAVLGVGYFVVIVAFVAAVVLVYDKAFTPHTDVTLTTTTMGNALDKGADVKLHGVPVGTVSAIHPDGSGAKLTLQLDPSVATTLPAATSALLLPKTLFGERYVDLVLPTGAGLSSAPGGLHDGSTIVQETSDRAVQLQDVFDNLLPMLRALEPQKLQATLASLAQFLDDEGGPIGTDLTSWDAYFKKINPQVPQMADDIEKLGVVANQYADAVPDLLDALSTSTTTAQTIAAQQNQLAQVFATVTSAGDTTHGWLDQNSQRITVLANQSKKALDVIAPYAPEFPCLFKAAADYVPVMDKALGKGTDQPGMHVVLNVEPSRGKYVYGTDHFQPTVNGGPRCPYETTKPYASYPGVPTPPAPSATPSDSASTGSANGGTSATPSDSASTGSADGGTSTGSANVAGIPTIPAPPSAVLERQVTATTQGAAGLGEENSPAENQMIAELVAPSVGESPAAYPDWASLLLGPLLRGAEVSLK